MRHYISDILAELLFIRMTVFITFHHNDSFYLRTSFRIRDQSWRQLFGRKPANAKMRDMFIVYPMVKIPVGLRGCLPYPALRSAACVDETGRELRITI